MRWRGYTLIELLLVVALLGMAGSLLVPQMVGRDSLRAQAAVRRVVADLSFAQSDALAHQEFRRVQFLPDGAGYAIVRVSAATYAGEVDLDTADYIVDPMSGAGSQGRYITDFTADPRFEDVTISSVDIDDGNDFVVYDPLGGTIQSGDAPGTGGAIELSCGEDVFRITISAFTGKLTVARVAG